MVYLSKETTDFLSLSIKAAQESADKTLSFGKGEDNVLKLRIINEDAHGIYFTIGQDEIFEITLFSYHRGIIPYLFKDREYIGETPLWTVNEHELTNPMKHIRLHHYALRTMVSAIVNSLITYSLNPEEYKQELESDSLHIIRLVYYLFLCEISKYCSWGVEYTTLANNSVTIKVNGNHFKGLVEIKYNRGEDLFEILYKDAKTLIPKGGRTHVYFDELIQIIDKQIEYIPTYKNK